MDTIVFSDYTVQDILLPVLVAAIFLFVISKLTQRILRGKKPEEEHIQPAQCPHCGWEGRVSRYAGRCPSCNEPLGERKATPYSRKDRRGDA